MHPELKGEVEREFSICSFVSRIRTRVSPKLLVSKPNKPPLQRIAEALQLQNNHASPADKVIMPG